MEGLSTNSVLDCLRWIFNVYANKEEDPNNVQNHILSKKTVVQIFYDYNVLDTCGYNIFHLNEFLNQLSPELNSIELKHFLLLIFYIYRTQVEPKEDTDDLDVDEVSVNDINSISEDKDIIRKSTNIIRVILDDYEYSKKIFKFLTPNLKNEEFRPIFQYEVLDQISKYMYDFNEEIFCRYNSEDKDKGILFFNITKLNRYFIDFNIVNLFTGHELLNYVLIFYKPSNKNETVMEELIKFFEVPMNDLQIKDLFENYFGNPKELNFSYSSILLLTIILSLHLKSTQGCEISEKIRFFFEDILHLKRDDADLFEEKIEEEKVEEIIDDSLPDSETLKSAKIKDTYGKDDIEFLHDFLGNMDKVLPPEDEIILSFSNKYPNPVDKIVTINGTENNKTKGGIEKEKLPLFPTEKLYVEITEERERQTLKKEKEQIAKAKKPEKNRNKKELPVDAHMRDRITKEENSLKYLGNPIINTLTNRLIKNSIKEVLPNSHVYPTLIKETLMIPNACPQKCMELIVESMEDQVKGEYETAIKRLEKAYEIIPKENNKIDGQILLFFNLSFGALYETLGYNITAMKYFYNAYNNSAGLIRFDPDLALPYCFLGEFFIRIKEFNWALRAYLMAKNIREETVGGDTPDTASVYNNLGVACYCLESYLPADGYFKLAYEIYKELLGINHPRTMLVKGNISKMKQLSFNKNVEFKTLSLYETPTMTQKNNRKKKK